MRRRNGFTLIEMLIVITVIAILAGITFRLVQIAKRKADTAKTIAKLERVQYALNEFKAEYGIYPPVEPNVCQIHGNCRVCYQYESTNMQPSWLCMNYFVDYPNGGNLFDMGLVSFLELRDKGSIIFHRDADEWVDDTPRDVLAKKGWSHFLDGVIGGGTQSNIVEGTAYWNAYDTIKDSWDQVIHYESDPPYQTYRLWSDGPTGDKDDDIHKDRWDD